MSDNVDEGLRNPPRLEPELAWTFPGFSLFLDKTAIGCRNAFLVPFGTPEPPPIRARALAK